jgi:hypothetical protein
VLEVRAQVGTAASIRARGSARERTAPERGNAAPGTVR